MSIVQHQRQLTICLTHDTMHEDLISNQRQRDTIATGLVPIKTDRETLVTG